MLKANVNAKHHPDKLLKSTPYKGEGKRIIAIGASTGGVDAIAKILKQLPRNLPPIIITQHIPDGFSTSFANRLNRNSELDVFEVRQTMVLRNSCAYLAPGGAHMLLDRYANDYYAKPQEGIRISRHCPSVDVMFRSLNNVAGKAALAIIMTGMGDDGSIGIKELYDNAAYTIAQDEASCVVFGMPKQAIAKGAICDIVGLDFLHQKIIAYANGELKRNH
ncbi:CheB methylesterase domain-containing protein [Helicobacter sp.]|uniref:CheB methylesterase domain-containing protein n=1 Tax=Helicobacter sp. TaxID=218 RepID=UPI0025C24633|nr:CheB methylesterase domain-containing protein [Helicobacter sp.]MCI5968635.1 CheB methylesterase domain-containing protein [Helicobacter sp.]MDY2584458.1 CheB methylesterase domain-containing protein [Helicobacter sp.]